LFTYKQSTGELTAANGVISKGYSGAQGIGFDNPSEQFVKDLGPIPQGFYTIEGPPFNTTEHGPYVMRLTPDARNDMEGRSGFLMHGDSVLKPGTASEGCIIMAHSVREAVWASGDRRLQVIA
jgi:hypothetical protein